MLVYLGTGVEGVDHDPVGEGFCYALVDLDFLVDEDLVQFLEVEFVADLGIIN